jgi:hypothetical protein
MIRRPSLTNRTVTPDEHRRWAATAARAGGRR